MTSDRDTMVAMLKLLWESAEHVKARRVYADASDLTDMQEVYEQALGEIGVYWQSGRGPNGEWGWSE